MLSSDNTKKDTGSSLLEIITSKMLLNAALSTEVVKANSNKAQTFQLADKKQNKQYWDKAS